MGLTAVRAPECGLCKDRSTCFFTELKDKDFEDFKGARISNVYKKRQVVFYEGHMPHGVFIVCRGRVKVYKSDHKGHQLTMRIASPGDLLGYRALVARQPYTATAEALEDAALSYIDETAFRTFLEKHNLLALKLLTHLAEDVRQAEDKARDMAMKSSHERLAELLLMLNATYGGKEKDKPGGQINVPFTRLDLAELTGLAQETVIRLLAEMEEKKIIATKGRSITILNLKGLEKQASFVG
jgi:CRP/FNR family transcriptional regulator